jgi:hypothetical protein
MTENVEKMLVELAGKLGTTIEHLWEVLIRQSYIAGISDILAIIIWSVIFKWTYHVIKRKTTSSGLLSTSCADWDDEQAKVAWMVWVVFAFIAVSIVACSLGSIIGSLVNPEYWALNQLVSAGKGE